MTSQFNHTPPKDLVAIFHCSFHPTRGNVIDWSSETLDGPNAPSLEGIEFSALPSGLHLVDDDVIHLTKGSHHGICLFRRRSTSEVGRRGFRLESLGVLVKKSKRPKPWNHIPALKTLAASLDQTPENWNILKQYFDKFKLSADDAEIEVDEFVGWEEELGEASSVSDVNLKNSILERATHPLHHLPHLLRVLGPSSLTLYKHVLGGRRVLIYTHPSAEPACVLAQIAADLCFDPSISQRKGPPVLGMITLHDIDRLEGCAQSGWIACTTDKIFLEKPWLYDLVIDLTTAGSEQTQTFMRGSRPTMYMSRKRQDVKSGSRASWNLCNVRFTWSDITLWNQIEKILIEDENDQDSSRGAMKWADPWKVYEDVCIVCAGLVSGNWRATAGSSSHSHSTKDNESDSGDEQQRGVLGTEGRPKLPSRSSTLLSISTLPARPPRTASIIALLEIFHQHTAFLLSALDEVLSGSSGSQSSTSLIITPRRLLTFELGPLSEVDALFVEWLGARDGRRKIVVRRGWKDLAGAVFGFV